MFEKPKHARIRVFKKPAYYPEVTPFLTRMFGHRNMVKRCSSSVMMLLLLLFLDVKKQK